MAMQEPKSDVEKKSRSPREIVESLIAWHFEVEPDLEQVFWLRGDSDDDPIRLLEVNAATVPSETIEAFAFSPAGDIPYRVVVAEITPEELDRLLKAPEHLPAGWDIRHAECFARSKAA